MRQEYQARQLSFRLRQEEIRLIKIQDSLEDLLISTPETDPLVERVIDKLIKVEELRSRLVRCRLDLNLNFY